MSSPATNSAYYCSNAGDYAHQPLLSINAGVPADVALESASCSLSVVQGLLRAATAGDGVDQNTAFAIAIIVDQAKAVIDATWSGLEDLEARASQAVAAQPAKE